MQEMNPVGLDYKTLSHSSHQKEKSIFKPWNFSDSFWQYENISPVAFLNIQSERPNISH